MEEFILEAKKVSYILSVCMGYQFHLDFHQNGWQLEGSVDNDIKLRGPENENENQSGWWF